MSGSRMDRTVEWKGCNLSYSVQGVGPPVLLIQGVGVQGLGWQPQIDELASDYQCIVFDNRGVGASQPIGNRISVSQLADDALAILNAERIDTAHIVGHSLGGLIALQFALSERKRVRSISLLCTFPSGRVFTQSCYRGESSTPHLADPKLRQLSIVSGADVLLVESGCLANLETLRMLECIRQNCARQGE